MGREKYRGRTAEPSGSPRQAGPGRIRIVTYNVHRCLGVDGRLAPGRVAEVIAETGSDVVALQELDVRRARSGGVDQAEAIALHLGMDNLHFHPALRMEEEEYGDAIITSLPLRLVRAGALPGLAHRPRIEPRGALWVEVEVAGRTVNVVNTHLGLRRQERRAQARALLGPEWLGHLDRQAPLILTGDFNSFPRGAVYRMITQRLRDAHRAGTRRLRPRRTYPSGFPVFRIDHIFVGEGMKVHAADTHRSVLSRAASDHLPLVADIELLAATRDADP
jgi:endonuclease/exonuclease/phosphatase family metal-dependent hydrolase